MALEHCLAAQSTRLEVPQFRRHFEADDLGPERVNLTARVFRKTSDALDHRRYMRRQEPSVASPRDSALEAFFPAPFPFPFPFPNGYEVQSNAIWAATDFMEANGAMRPIAKPAHSLTEAPAS